MKLPKLTLGMAFCVCGCMLSSVALAGIADAKAAYAKRDYAKAMQEYQSLASLGDDRAQNSIGVMYHKGQGVEKDMKEAVKWYRLAAAQGNSEAQYNLGDLYWAGEGVVKDLQESIKLFRMAAGQGDANAQNRLGVFYNSGEGVEKDVNEAVKWYRLAAAQGNRSAMYNLSSLAVKSQEVTQDKQKAVNSPGNYQQDIAICKNEAVRSVPVSRPVTTSQTTPTNINTNCVRNSFGDFNCNSTQTQSGGWLQKNMQALDEYESAQAYPNAIRKYEANCMAAKGWTEDRK